MFSPGQAQACAQARLDSTFKCPEGSASLAMTLRGRARYWVTAEVSVDSGSARLRLEPTNHWSALELMQIAKVR